MSLSRTVAEALRYLGAVRNYSPASIANYQASFDQYLHFLRTSGHTDDIRHFTSQTVYRFMDMLMTERRLKASTVVVRLSALSSIARVLMRLTDARGKPILAQNPTKAFDWPVPDHAESGFLLPREMAAFMAAERPLRESVARELLADAGMRVSELCRANVGDVISVKGQTAIAATVKGRSRKARKEHITISSAAASHLFEYLMERGITNPQDPDFANEPLVPMSNGHRFTRTALSALMARIGQQAGIHRIRTSAHKLRHTATVVSGFAKYKDGRPLDRWTRSKLRNDTNSRSIDRYEHHLPGQLFEAREAQREALEQYMADERETQ